MNAEPLLSRIAKAFSEVRLEAVMVGNAAAALMGAPVTTLDIDFMFRKTPANLKKLKALADLLSARVLRPYYPVSSLYRVVNDDEGIQLDFMSVLHGVPSFEGLRAVATAVDFGGCLLHVAPLDAVLRSKKTLGRPKDMAVIEILERTLREKETLEKEAFAKGRSGGAGKGE